MIFTSINFLLFFILSFSFYRLLSNFYKGYFLIICSFVFYAFWSIPFSFLLFVSAFFTFLFANLVYKFKSKKILFFLIFILLIPLFFYKYLNFFILDFINPIFNKNYHLNFYFLPLGISFYTFQAISYLVDVYKNKIKPHNFSIVLLYISFFPQLIAGPIERASNLMPQFSKVFSSKNFELSDKLFFSAILLITIGVFKKIVIADNISFIVDDFYSDPNFYSRNSMIIIFLLFSFQIFFDFSSYTDIARGVARLFGINLSHNFNLPYLSQNISQFWRKWHITLSNWFKDYIYIPLGGNRSTIFFTTRNLLIVFLLCGLWHGAKFTFILWGLLHGFYYFIFYVYRKYIYLFFEKIISRHFLYLFFYKSICIFLTFVFVTFAWIFFRADDFEQLKLIIINFLNPTYISYSWEYFFYNSGVKNYLLLYISLFIIFYHLFEFLYRNNNLFNEFFMRNTLFKLLLLIFLLFTIYFFGNHGTVQYIYFQF